MPRILTIGAVWVCLAAGAIVITFSLSSKPAPTPTHVTAEFVYGVDNHQYQLTCGVWRTGRSRAAQCEQYLTFLAASGGQAWFRVRPHTVREWLEHGVPVASVRVAASNGTTLTARLVKTKHGWLVVSVT